MYICPPDEPTPRFNNLVKMYYDAIKLLHDEYHPIVKELYKEVQKEHYHCFRRHLHTNNWIMFKQCSEKCSEPVNKADPKAKYYLYYDEEVECCKHCHRTHIEETTDEEEYFETFKRTYVCWNPNCDKYGERTEMYMRKK